MKSKTIKLLTLIIIVSITACNSNGSKDQPSGTDTSNSIVLPEDRSSDSLTATPNAGSTDSTGNGQRSTDSLKRQ